MHKDFPQKKTSQSGFTLLEILASIAIFFVVMAVLTGFIVWMYRINARIGASREAADNLQRVMETIVREARRAESVYTPTTNDRQLSLKVYNNLPVGEIYSFVDFFVCGTQLCLKKEESDPIALTSDKLQIKDFYIKQIMEGTSPSSVQIGFSLDYSQAGGTPDTVQMITATSTAVLRVY